MSLVGRVGSLISQGVYSVATPFHPFGGAVDVIVVQQQDGSFRSAPWYVRFGKFQGVLKGAEKIVRINVNGVEANFHMYLDNSGEAYFIKEVESGDESKTNEALKDSDSMEMPLEDGSAVKNIVHIGQLKHSVSDSGVAQLREECDSSGVGQFERTESDVDRRYYDFQDEQSSVEGSVEISEYGSGRYENLDSVPLAEPHGLDSEVILVSVDGHVLTAPVSESEQNAENGQLNTSELTVSQKDAADESTPVDDARSSDYVNKLNASVSSAASDNDFSVSGGINAFANHLEVCEGDGEHACLGRETMEISRFEGTVQICTLSEEESPTKREVFKSCLELTKLLDHEEMCSPKVQNSNGECPRNSSTIDRTPNGNLVEFTNDGSSPACKSESRGPDGSHDLDIEVKAIEKTTADVEHIDSDVTSAYPINITNDPEEKHEDLCPSTSSELVDSNSQRPAAEDVSRKDEASGEEIQAFSSMRFEISLCGKELCAGMGSEAAAKVFESHLVSVEEFKTSATSVIKNENLIVRYDDKYLPWEKAAPAVLGMVAFGLELPVDPKDTIPVEQGDTPENRDIDTGLTSTPSSRRWRLWPIPFRRVKTLEHSNSNASSEELFLDTESGLQNSNAEPTPYDAVQSPHKQYIRTNVPTSEQIASLNLKDGQNVITFSFSTRVLGTQQEAAHIYLWKWNTRIVISDVDGTITKSDVLGQFMPLVGKDWSQSGVAKLFSAIKENGYQLLFLSARAIVQAYLTRSFLFNLKQDGTALPNGPVVISPDGLFPSLYREVIRRAPHEFKIACLENIRRLFPADYNPFYAGFGNRDTDELSYKKMGIPKGKIFIINPKGEVAISHRIDVKSYTSLHTLVNEIFPPTSLIEQEDYNSWNFWKMPLPDIDDL
ncbi:hypothetical protein K2173_019622 [Erythroxylum novogranatense]|uniref:phosphatidate phosphatase n=1 Tax=Erythroxylum novogranatense TaxID=1862640 RepID=A0AAV8UFS1_9ROSI|nr:hypothetical protein K2173_019622 [Erythroxylum novogranatense]